MDAFILKGPIVYSRGPESCSQLENGYAICSGGICQGVFSRLPEEFEDLPILDQGKNLILPGFTDLHLHAPQLSFQGLGMDLELMDWLQTYTFPEESKYRDPVYADRAYRQFTDRLLHSTTTRAAVFATAHTEPTWHLMKLLEQTGLVTYVGRVNMDRDAPDSLREPDAETALAETMRWLNGTNSLIYTKPMLTPRFIPSCSASLLSGLGALAKRRHLPIQSHLSESPGEIQLVHTLYPRERSYGHVYDRFGLLNSPCIMAHCVHSSMMEEALLKQRGVYIAHCPESNMNLSSGVAPVRRFLEDGLHVGLGTDVGAGTSVEIMRAMGHAIGVSKLRWRMQDPSLAPLTFPEVFYMATLGGGSFFGNVGSFLPGYEFDAVVIDDSRLSSVLDLSPLQRAERLCYLAEEVQVTDKYVQGRKVL